MKRFSQSLTRIFYLLYSLLLLGFTVPSNAQDASIDRVKIQVSYTYNFAKNIRWPNEGSLKSFKIGLYQVSDEALIREFNKLGNTLSKGARTTISQTRNLNSLVNFDLIYVGTNDETVINTIVSLIEGKPILMVTNNVANKRLVMLNLFETEPQQLQFEVNNANLLNNGLTPLPELILLGGTEIDIAKLYREGQSSLVEMQSKLNTQQAQFIQLQEKIAKQQEINNRMIGQMQSLSTDIKNMRSTNTTLNKELNTLNTTIEQSREIIKEQQQEIALSEQEQARLISQVSRRNQELNDKQTELDDKQAELLIRQQALDAISKTINDKEAELVMLNETIGTQEQQLQEQQLSISKLDELVSAQQRSLYFLWALVISGTLLSLVVIYAYRTKRQDNERLARQSHDLRIARDKLAVAKRKAEAANRAKGAFLSLMSHELRTPLQSIIGYTDLIIEDFKMNGNDTYVDQLVRVNTNGERLLELINNTLDLAKIEAGKMKVELSPTNMRALVEEAIDNVKPLITKNKNELKVKLNNSRITPELDYSKLLHMLVNLLSNANKFTKNGTITITIDNQVDKMTLIVSDTGIGLTEEQQRSIFNRFHQVHSGQNKNIKGTGLGLSITQHFCEIMGGTIHAESPFETGSDFIVEIPLPVVITEKKFIALNDPEEEAA